MATLTITHTHAEGTLIEGTAKGDGSAAALKANRWRWGRSIGCWYVPQSRDRNARQQQIDNTARELREFGFTVDFRIDNTPRSEAEIAAAKAARAAARDRAERDREYTPEQISYGDAIRYGRMWFTVADVGSTSVGIYEHDRQRWTAERRRIPYSEITGHRYAKGGHRRARR